MPPKKGKVKEKAPPPPAKPKPKVTAPPVKPKKIPPPPACFTIEDLVQFKAIYKAFDEDNIDLVPITAIPFMLRKVGFNPKGAEIKQLFVQFLEDDLVDTVEYYQWLFMIEAKLNWGDDFEAAVTNALAALGHDDEEETGFADIELLKEQLMKWGEPLSEIEFAPWLVLAKKDKTYNVEDGRINYVKFIENLNLKDVRYIKEPINFFKLDQRTLAEMAMKKAAEEREEQERKEAEKKAREEAKRLKMIEDGLLPPD